MKPKIPQQIFKNESASTPQHDEMLLIFNKYHQIYHKLLIKHFYNCGLLLDTTTSNKIGLQKRIWTPEYPLINNNYYIGSIDLFMKFVVRISQPLIDKVNNNKFSSMNDSSFTIIFEFKPIIKSYSEVIRQIKVYETFLKQRDMNPFLVVVTYSDVSKFKEVFTSQRIEIIQLQKEEVNQTKL